MSDDAASRGGSALTEGLGPTAWRFRFPTGARWHYTEHGPHEATKPELKWEPLYSEAAMEAATAAKVDAALHEAIAAIYFDDRSKFGPALWNIVRILGGQSCATLLEENPRACYAASSA